MIKNLLFAMGLMSLALASGCAKGGNGIVPPPASIAVTITSPVNTNSGAIYPTQTLTLTATVSNATTTAVTWTCAPTAACAKFTPVTPATTPATATYVAPATAGSQATITATLTAEPSVTGTLTLNLVDITTDVAPATLSIGNGLIQQFTAVAVPNAAPQTFTWTCTANNVACVNFSPLPGVSSAGLAVYTAQDPCSGNCVQISAASTVDSTGCSTNPKNCTIAKASLVTSRISGTYAFRVSGYDSSNHAVAVVGTFTATSNGIINSGGVEYEVTSSGRAKYAIGGGTYSLTAPDPKDSNNAGTLVLALPAGVYPNQYQIVLDGAGDIEMIESDLHGSASGVAEKSNPSVFTGTTDQTFAFGFTGVDSGLNPVGYAGVLPMNGSGMIVGGQMDANDNGNITNICGASPCNVGGTYSADGSIAGLWHMTLTSGVTMHFDLFVASTQTSKTNPLTFFAITDPVDTTIPAVSGTMVLQDSTLTYNNAAFKGASVSALTGVNGANTNVSLTLGSTDGSGNFSGQFDQNNAGTILSSVQFPPTTGTNSYKYAATPNSTNQYQGRYTFGMLGNPAVSPVVAPVPFVLYASGANSGFLIEIDTSTSVMTGTMNSQGKGGGVLAASSLPGTYAAATTSSGSSAVDVIAANLLLTFVNTGACTSDCVNGTLYHSANFNPSGATVSGANPSYTLVNLGNGTLALTAPSAQNYVIYAVDTSGCTNAQNPVCSVLDFFMMDVDSTNKNASIIFAQQ